MRAIGGVLAAALAMACVGCSIDVNPLDTGEPRGEGSTITVGSQGTSESEILAQLYGQVLENADYVVKYDLSIGSRGEFLKDLAAGSIDLIPDYAGTLLHKADATATATEIADIYAALPAALEPLGLTALEPAEAENADALLVTPEFAEANAVASIGDLSASSSTLTVGAQKGFDALWAEPLDSAYGFSGFTLQVIEDPDEAATVQQLLDGLIQIAHLRTTSPGIAESNLVALNDPANIFIDQNVVPLLDVNAYSDEIADLLNEVSALLTTSELARLNALYASDDRPTAAEIATQWLTANRLLT